MTSPKEITVLNRINLSTQRLFSGSQVWGGGSFTSDSYDVAGRVRDCALASFAEPFGRRNAVSSAANGAWNGKRPSGDNPVPLASPSSPPPLTF